MRVAEEDAPRLGQRHPSRGSDEERRSELVLEAADLSAHGRLRDAESARCTSDVALLGDRHEVLDLREAHRRMLLGGEAAVSVGRPEIQMALDRDSERRHARQP